LQELDLIKIAGRKVRMSHYCHVIICNFK